MNIYYFSPYSLEKKLGKAYNEYISLVPSDNDWICLTDMDTMFLGKDVGQQLNEIIELNNGIALFTGVTNRIGTRVQLIPEMWNERDIGKHREIALKIQNEKRNSIEIVNQNISGFLMLFPKVIWRQVGGFIEDGILDIDYDFSAKILKLNKKIAVMKGVYMFHYYRLNEGPQDTSHLK